MFDLLPFLFDLLPFPKSDARRKRRRSAPGPSQCIHRLGVELLESRRLLSDGAQLISLSPASGGSVAANATFTEVVTMKNTGTSTWTGTVNGFTLNRNPVGTDPFQQGSVYYTALNTAPVAPGGTGTFTMHLKAPASAGTYTETWQMSNVSQVLFGQTASLTLTVPTPVLPNAQYISETVPPGTSEPVNTSFTETVTMKNTGNTTWITGINGYTLNLLTTAQFGETGSPIYAQLNQSSVAPGSNGTFTISMKTQPTAGTYTETWRMNSSVPDGNQPIGDNVTVQIVVPTPVLPNAQYISETVPPGTSEPVNTSFIETVTMKNTGNTTWITGINGYTLNLLTTAQFGGDRQPDLRAVEPKLGGPRQQRDVHDLDEDPADGGHVHREPGG